MSILGYSVVEHHDDGSTKVINKVSANDMAALISGMGGARRGGQYTYLNADACPEHGAWRAVPAGISKTTNKPYKAFWGCDQPAGEERCTNKPSREWVETHPADRSGNDASQFAPNEPPAAAASSSEFDDLPF